jgi:tripartite-type tricarboxylate transporter receptor subunit TctC
MIPYAVFAAALTRRRGLALLVAALTATGRPAQSADRIDWPPRTIRFVVAYPVGGVSSGVARLLAQALERHLGSTVIVDHRPGAGGTLAMDQVARSAPDGATLCFSAITPLTLAPWLGRVPYDPVRDIVAVFPVMATPVLVLGTEALMADSLASMLMLARKMPGQIRWATSGPGTTGHLVLERVAAASGTVITHVPYKGGGQQINDALGGQFEVLSSNVAATQLRLVREGRLKPLAVSGAERVEALANVPTLAELGFPEANQVSVFGLFAAGATPSALVDRINEALSVAWQDPALQRHLSETHNLPLGGNAKAFQHLIAVEREVQRLWFATAGKR